MIHREAPKCPICGKPTAKEIHLDQSDVPISQRMCGDTFVEWERIEHECTNDKKHNLFKCTDELTGVTKEMFDVAMPNLDNVDRSKIIIISTPKGGNSFYQQYLEQNKETDIVPNPNKLYEFVCEKLKDVPVSYQPRLAVGDVVVVLSEDLLKNEYYRNRDIKCFNVKIIKRLSKWKRKSRDNGKVGNVPYFCLEPYKP